jgi:hypothetical protein
MPTWHSYSQPLDAYMAFTHYPLLEALQQAIKAGIPQHVIDVGGAATGGVGERSRVKFTVKNGENGY